MSLAEIEEVPRTGARVWYDDQRRVHDEIHRGEELIDYAFMGAAASVWATFASPTSNSSPRM